MSNVTLRQEKLSASQPGRAVSLERARRYLIFLSPVAIILGGQIAARTLGSRLGAWGWLPLFAGYWTAAALLTVWGAGWRGILGWFQPSRGGRGWAAITAVLLAAPALPMLFPDTWRLFLQTSIWLPTLLFVLVNPAIEECYWRGLLLGAASKKHPWAGVLYSSVLFAVNHLWIGILAAGARSPAASVYQFLFGLLTAVVYLKTGSLRWPVFTHFIVNLLTPTVAVFLNLYTPGS